MSDRSPETVLWDCLRGATATRALGVAAELGIAERLVDGPQSVTDLAQATKVHPQALHRVLRALASDGVFAEDEPGTFRNTEISDRLRTNGWPQFAHLFGSVFFLAMSDLDRAVETGRATFPDSFGTDFWSWLATRPDERAAFDVAMAGGREGNAARIAGLEWRADEVVVDVGGGNGALLAALLRLRPELRGIVFDLPETVRDESAFGARIEFVPGSFFERVPPGDAYLLSGILHDWDDDHAATILQVVRAAAPDEARMFVLESVVPDGNEPFGAKWLDLLMLVLLNGRERTADDWRALIEPNGFRVERIEDGLIETRCR